MAEEPPRTPRGRAKRGRETVRDEDVVRSTRERAARHGLRDEDIMMSARERARLRGEDVSPPRGDGAAKALRGRPGGGAAGSSARESAGPPSARPSAGPPLVREPPSGASSAAPPVVWEPPVGASSAAPPVVWEPPAGAAPPAVWEPAATPRPAVALVPWSDLEQLALKFDPLAITGGLDRAIALSDRMRGEFALRGAFSAEPIMLGACLSFECRSYRHCGIVPEGDDLRYLSALFRAVIPD